MKKLHKILSMVLCVVMVFTMSPTAVSASGESIMYDLTSLGITGGFGFEDHLDSNITRAEFAQLVVNMMNHKEIAKSMESEKYFSDVADSPYKGAINLLYKEEIVSGTGNGKYEPERNVRYTEACKMLIKALGYHVIVSDTSLASYTFLAGTRGVTANVDSSKEYITVRDMLVMVDNCLDIDKMVPMYYNNNIAPSYVVDEGNTFRKTFKENAAETLVKMRGVVTADVSAYLYEFNAALRETQLEIEGEVFDFNGIAPLGYVGVEVEFYVAKASDGSKGKIMSLISTNKNTIVEISITDSAGQFYFFVNGNQRLTTNLLQILVKRGRFTVGD